MGNFISWGFQNSQSMNPRYTIQNTAYTEPEERRTDMLPCKFYRNQCRVLETHLSDAEEILTKHTLPGRDGTVSSAGLCWSQPVLLELRRRVKVGKTLIESCHVDEPCLQAYLRRGERTLAFAESLKEIMWCMSVGFYNSARCLQGSYPSMAMNEFPLPELGAYKELCMMLEAASDDEKEILESLDIWITKHRCSIKDCGGPQQQAEDPPLCIATQISERRKDEKKTNGITRSEVASDQVDHTSVLWNINSKILEDGKLIGSGGFCSVIETTWLGDTYAKKIFRMERPVVFRNEADALSKLTHPHMVTVSAYSMGSQGCSLLMERMPYDLRQYMTKRQEEDGINPPFSVSAAIDLMLQGAEAMRYMHSQKMVHRDLKPGNILVKPLDDPELCNYGFVIAKLADFGLAKSKGEVTAYSHMTANQGTTLWMAPEVFGGNKKNDERLLVAFPRKADVWSFGIVCSEVLSGKVPYQNVNLSRLHKRLTDSDNPLRPELPESCPKRLASLIRECWDIEPRKRPTFKEICTRLRYLKGLLLLTGGCELEPWMETKLQSTVDVDVKHELGVKQVPNPCHQCCLFYTTFDGSSWTPAAPLPVFMASFNGMSLADHAGTLVGVHRGLEQKIHPRQLYWSTYTSSSSSWSPAQPIISQTSPSRPALATFKERLYCLYRGEGNEIWWTSALNSNLYNWTSPVIVGGSFRTSDGPALATCGRDRLVSVVRGFDNYIYWDSFHGSIWHGYEKMENLALTSGSPALAVYKDDLYCCVRGTDMDMPGRLYWGKFSCNKWSSFSKVDYHFAALSGPSLAVFNDQLVCTVQGPRNQLYYTTFDGSRWSEVSTVPSQAPCIGEQGLCAFDSKLFCVYGAP